MSKLEDCKDNGEWLLEQLDLTGLEEWSKDLQEKAHAQKKCFYF